MNIKVPIHTTLTPLHVQKLKEYGQGRINDGIETVISLAESKQYNTKKELKRIANKILNEIE